MWKKIFPAYGWISVYPVRYLGSDAVSGVTLAAYAIPVSLAYATLAGLPPQYGIYGYLLGGILYAMLGTGKQIAIGPTAAVSLLIGTTIADMAGGDIQRWADIASLTGLIFAGMSIIAYVIRLSGIVNFISDTVLLGFKAGAAVTIGLTQLPKLFGVPGGGDNFFEHVIVLIEQLPQTDFTVLIFGISATAIIIAGEKFLPGRPIAIFVVIISIILISVTSLGSAGFAQVGVIPAGLPEFHLPSLNINDVDGVIPLAFACFMLAYIENVSAAKALAQKNGYEIDAHQELLALGTANLAVSLFHGYPVTGGLSQSVVNDKAGAKTPMSLLFASATIALCLLFLTDMLKNLPVVILAAIVLVAIKSLIDIKEFKRLYKVNKYDFRIAIVALAGVILFGILNGVLLAAVVSLVLLLKEASNPHVAFLGRIPGTNKFSDLARHPDNENIPGVLLFRVESSLLYFNVTNIYNKVWQKVLSCDESLKTVIFDLGSSPGVDMAGARIIKRLYLNLKAKGISLRIVDAYAGVRDMLRSEDLEHLLGRISRMDTINEIVEDCVNKQKSDSISEVKK
ncbi:MAG: SulP family inorganic anion transporter [Ignavibacteriae bacterium]|nr:SulP family inorganic anion transporter [Ignavibacteriota bacterium]